ncbi:hypothetical protein KAJ02_05070 [Candidatus Bipolaricaulota bacterium]|nr:hypothetical protein [Candidatus Bipolaricaulota bacterium]
MNSKTKWIVGLAGILAAVILVIVLWPAPDPLAGVETVAIRVGDEPPSQQAFDYEEELGLVLSGRDLRIVSDESSADLVLALDDFRVNLGDIEISLTEGSLRGKASAVCIVTDVRTGKTHTMDFIIRFENGEVHAELVGRKFWEFWK